MSAAGENGNDEGAGKVLVIRLSSLGDVVLATSALEAIARDLPGQKVDVLTKPEFAQVFEGNPVVAKVLEWPPGKSPFAMASAIRREGYDYIIDLHANLRTRLLRVLVPGRWSVYGKGALSRRLAVKLGRRAIIAGAPHVVERYAGALSVLGVGACAMPRLYVNEDEREAARNLMTAAGWDGETPPVAFAPGARWATKGWPVERWREVCKWTRELEGEGFNGFFPVLTGGSEDIGLADQVLGSGVGANLAGKTSIKVTGALLEQCRALVTNDSAPLHLAEAVGTPVVAVFGPTVEEFGFKPLGPRDRVVESEIECRPCSLHGDDKCPRGHFKCMVELEPRRVLETLAQVLGEREIGR